MNDLERFHATMNYAPRDRAAFHEFFWPTWPETEERWNREGGYQPGKNPFGCDRWEFHFQWFFPDPPFAREIVEEDEKYVTYVDPQGIVQKEFKKNPARSMPMFVRFPVETLCTLFYDDPAWVEEMMDADADFLIGMLGQILEETSIDVFGFWEDMGYNAGPLISPAMVRKYMLPRYRRVVDFARARGVKLFCLDSDGKVDTLVPVWMDAGIDIIYPWEVQAGMDANQIRKRFGRQLRLWGGVDKRALVRGRKEIDAEIAYRKPLIDAGGYIPMLDHSAPPDIPYDNYCYFIGCSP